MLLAFAHPDDEVFVTGATIALQARRGVEVSMIVATGGEEGEVVNPDLQGRIDLHDLPAIRQQEMACSQQSLGIHEIARLGYRDSGMADSHASRGPNAFCNQDLDSVAEQVVALMRQYRPQVVVTFDPNGGYGHPDHIMIQRATLAAFERSANAYWYPEAGDPWQPLKLYYMVVPRNMIQDARAVFESRGLTFVMGTGLPDVERDPNFGYPNEDVTTMIDVRETLLRKREALRCYATQTRPDNFLLTTGDDVLLEAFGHEYFVLVRSDLKTEIPEHDLFAAL